MNVDWSTPKLLVPYSPVDYASLSVNGGPVETTRMRSKVTILFQKAITTLREGGEIVLKVEAADDVYK